MHLKQLAFLREVVDHGFHVSDSATALHTSQPSVSRQIQALERELGTTIFVRSKKRFLGLTKTGEEVVKIARRILKDVDRLKSITVESAAEEEGVLTVSTSHTQARYVLPKVIRSFTERYPKVSVILRQGTPLQTIEWVRNGEADLSISSESGRIFPDVVQLPCYDQHKIIMVPDGHPLLTVQPLTIESLVKYPLITYDTQSHSRYVVTRAFESRGLRPNIVLSATDVDVMKTYVKSGLGVAIVVELAYDSNEDHALKSIDAKHLFQPSHISIGILKSNCLRNYVFSFIELFWPALTKPAIEKALLIDD